MSSNKILSYSEKLCTSSTNIYNFHSHNFINVDVKGLKKIQNCVDSFTQDVFT